MAVWVHAAQRLAHLGDDLIRHLPLQQLRQSAGEVLRVIKRDVGVERNRKMNPLAARRASSGLFACSPSPFFPGSSSSTSSAAPPSPTGTKPGTPRSPAKFSPPATGSPSITTASPTSTNPPSRSGSAPSPSKSPASMKPPRAFGPRENIQPTECGVFRPHIQKHGDRRRQSPRRFSQC